jgi:hypothetical protein
VFAGQVSVTQVDSRNAVIRRADTTDRFTNDATFLAFSQNAEFACTLLWNPCAEENPVHTFCDPEWARRPTTTTRAKSPGEWLITAFCSALIISVKKNHP